MLKIAKMYCQWHCGSARITFKTDTVSWWLKEVLKQAGIDNFTGHSTRAASSSAAKRSNIDLGTILKAAGWSNATPFNKFYNKPLQGEHNFGEDYLYTLLEEKNFFERIVIL